MCRRWGIPRVSVHAAAKLVCAPAPPASGACRRGACAEGVRRAFGPGRELHGEGTGNRVPDPGQRR